VVGQEVARVIVAVVAQVHPTHEGHFLVNHHCRVREGGGMAMRVVEVCEGGW
jgi:hypothetical protein